VFIPFSSFITVPILKMYAKTLLLGALSASCVQAASLLQPREVARCGAREPSAEHRAISAALAEEEANTVEALTTTDVDVYFHVVAASKLPEDGYIPVLLSKLITMLHWLT
jgi:hypothetical protein